MRRSHLIFFLSLIVLSIIPFFLQRSTSLVIAESLSSVLLFPIKTTSSLWEFASAAYVRIEKLEIMVNQLRLENAGLKRNARTDTTYFRNKEFELLKALIIGRDPSNINGFLIIDKGMKHNLYVNQPVMSINGLVGKIKHVGLQHSIVETIENRGFAISAIDFVTGVHGIVKQRGNLFFDYIRHNDEINIGDSILTSGMSEIFPEGILIGTVNKILEVDDQFFKHIYLNPAVQINRLTAVYLLYSEHSENIGGIRK